MKEIKLIRYLLFPFSRSLNARSEKSAELGFEPMSDSETHTRLWHYYIVPWGWEGGVAVRRR